MTKAAKFDRQAVVKKATDLYWEKGFHATSMRNLQEVIDMRPGSIYATFGSKEGLFKEVLQYYADMSLAQLTAYSQNTTSPINALKLFFNSAVIDSKHTAPSGMCMLVKTISELTDDNGELLSEAKRLLTVIETAMQDILNDAKKCGELSKGEDTARLARYLQMQLMGLRTYARANNSDVSVTELINDIFGNKPFLAQD
ncbi:TetR/AcrR family transcriptional regulator [Kangiella sp. HD9-110m-PIT-SAG07]|nr:TetR/AcrR family transcriptional regulator [Kangiella sp. HD9-110m-PIT-SAG07]